MPDDARATNIALRTHTDAPLADPLWVPLISHYSAPGHLDAKRWQAMIRSLSPYVSQFLAGGSTGDGWELDDAAFTDLVRAALAPDCFAPGATLLFGTLRATTEQVIARAQLLERLIASAPTPAASIGGIAVCPPIARDASQEVVLDHYERVIAATTLPVAVYELPQVTGCRVAPQTLVQLKANPRVTMFKDTSGEDVIAQAGAAEGIVALRGAEGKYADLLKPRGPYDGWLLSTGNAFARQLRVIAGNTLAHDLKTAQGQSDALTGVVQSLFAAAAHLPFGNAFSNANRAGDHVLAYGHAWREAPKPQTFSGGEIPESLLAEAAHGFERLGSFPEAGYLA